MDVKKLQGDMAALQGKYDTDVAALKLDGALEAALLGANVHNPKAARGMLNMDEIKLDGDKLLGLDTQVEALRKSDAYLFKGETQTEQTSTVSTGGTHGEGGISTDAFIASAMAAAGINTDTK